MTERKVLKRDGRVVKVVVVACPVCKRGKNLSWGEAAPLRRGLVPYCHDCLKAGLTVAMTHKVYHSGPTDLHV
jgi:hypothetical protein